MRLVDAPLDAGSICENSWSQPPTLLENRERTPLVGVSSRRQEYKARDWAHIGYAFGRLQRVASGKKRARERAGVRL